MKASRPKLGGLCIIWIESRHQSTCVDDMEMILPNGKIVIFDDMAKDYISKYKYHCSGNYCARCDSRKNHDGEVCVIPMHRELWELYNGKIPDGHELDHINHNRLDNRLENLRLVTRSQNFMNRSVICGKSKYKGVGWHKKDKRWRARIKINGKTIFIGNFKDEVDAAIAYDLKAIELFGKYACLNILRVE